MSDYVNPLHLFGICFPHKWGRWYTWDNGGWRLARSGEPAQRSCDHCNAKQER